MQQRGVIGCVRASSFEAVCCVPLYVSSLFMRNMCVSAFEISRKPVYEERAQSTHTHFLSWPQQTWPTNKSIANRNKGIIYLYETDPPPPIALFDGEFLSSKMPLNLMSSIFLCIFPSFLVRRRHYRLYHHHTYDIYVHISSYIKTKHTHNNFCELIVDVSFCAPFARKASVSFVAASVLLTWLPPPTILCTENTSMCMFMWVPGA